MSGIKEAILTIDILHPHRWKASAQSMLMRQGKLLGLCIELVDRLH